MLRVVSEHSEKWNRDILKLFVVCSQDEEDTGNFLE